MDSKKQMDIYEAQLKDSLDFHMQKIGEAISDPNLSDIERGIIKNKEMIAFLNENKAQYSTAYGSVFASMVAFRVELMGLEHLMQQGPVIDIGIGQSGFIEGIREKHQDTLCAAIPKSNFVMENGDYSFPFADESISLFYSLMIFDEQSIREEKLAPELYRMMKPGGVYIAHGDLSRPVDTPFLEAGLQKLDAFSFPAKFFQK
ncbi:MAG: hypothetical protein GY861_09785 [bacterium]|nr:hypothetical protein [bacterium]